MALWFPIMVNNFTVGQVTLVRLDPVDHQPVQNEICTYSLNYTDKFGRNLVKDKIEYPYQKNDPIPLLSAALQRVKECQST